MTSTKPVITYQKVIFLHVGRVAFLLIGEDIDLITSQVIAIHEDGTTFETINAIYVQA